MGKRIFTRILAITLVCLLAVTSGPVSMITFAETMTEAGKKPVKVEFKNSKRTEAIIVTIDGIDTYYTLAKGEKVSIKSGTKVIVNISDGKGGTLFGSVKYRTGNGKQKVEETPFEFTAGSSDEYDGVITQVTSWKEDANKNYPAFAEDDTAVTDEDTPVNIDVLANDYDLEEDAFDIIANTSPSKGTLTLDNGVFLYTPYANENGSDSFNYTITGGDTATVSITINPVDDLSEAVDDTASTKVNQAVTIDVLANDMDVEGNFEIISSQDPSHGSIEYTQAGYVYTPNTDYVGSDSFTYTLKGGSQATVSVSVEADTVPQPVEDNFWITVDDYHTVYVNGQILNNPDEKWTTVDGHHVEILDENIIAVKGEDMSNGTATISGFIAKLGNGQVTDGTWYYTLEEPLRYKDKEWYEAGYEGGLWTPVTRIPTSDYETYWKNKITDYKLLDGAQWIWSEDYKGSQFDSPVWFRSIVHTVNQPSASDDYLIVEENTQAYVPVLDNDSDPYGLGLEIVSVSSVANGQVQISEDEILFTPDADFNGQTSFTYTLSDGINRQASATVFVTVNSFNQKPEITLIGDNPQTVYLNATDYEDPGASANDPEDGDLSSAIQITSDVDVTKVGAYTVKYDVVDSKGLAADQVTRTVNVVKEDLVITSDLVADPHSVVDGETALVTVTLTDQYGDPVIGQTVIIYDDGIGKTASDQGDGTYTLVTKPAYGEDNEMTASVAGDLIEAKDYVDVTKAEIQVQSTLKADPNVVNEGETSKVIITLKDQYGDPLKDRSVEVFVDSVSIGFANESTEGTYDLVFTPGLDKDNIIRAKQNTVAIPETDQVTVIEKNKYLVTFDSNGGSDVEDPIVKEGQAVAQPEDPEKDNEKFLTWYLGDQIYDFSQAVTGNITLVAQWQKVEIKDEEAVATDDVELHIGYNTSLEDQEENLAASLTPDGTYESMVWEILDGANHIKLDTNGLVTGQTATGSEPAVVKVTVTFADDTTLTDTVNVSVINHTRPVTPPSVTPSVNTVSISLDTDYVELEYGTEALEEFFSYDFTETITGSSSTSVTWSVEDDEIVSIDENGLVKALKEGETRITVKHNASGKTASADVVVFLVGDELNPLGAVEFYDPYVYGYPDTTFRPKNSVTRAEVATMFAKILKLNLDYPGAQKFDDVNENDWYFPYVQAIARTEIFVGDTSGNFRPNEAITRAEIATVFAKYWSFLNINVDASRAAVTDVDTNHWASAYIYQMYNAGVVTGYPDGSFKPEDATLREQVVGMINTLIARPKYYPDYTKYLDIEVEHWAFGDIEAATTKYNVISDTFEEIE